MAEVDLNGILSGLEMNSMTVLHSLQVVDLRAQHVLSEIHSLIMQSGEAKSTRQLQLAVEDLRKEIGNTLPLAESQLNNNQVLLRLVPEYWNSEDRPQPDISYDKLKKSSWRNRTK